jgi:glycosyltransferase involved in cell wall biosynthesis
MVARPPTIAKDPRPGVNLAGFLEGELGLGEVARKLGRGLQAAGIPFAAIPYRRVASRQEHPLEFPVSAEAPYDTNLICLNADYLHEFSADVGIDFFAGRYSIGVWFWETTVFRPENPSGLRFLDEVWVASEYVRRALDAEASIPIHVAPLPIEEPAPPTLTRSDLALPDAYTFLYVFDFVSAERKNPKAVVEAFTRAFESGEGPVLVLKSINGRERKPALLAELQAHVADRPDIRIRDDYVSANTKNAITAACDCFVSLHRSEGFGLTIAEAMAHGKPVIATGYSGNMDFMDAGSSYLVPYRLVPVPSDWWAHAPGSEWAEPDVDAASALMRHVYEHQDEARGLGERAREEILRRFSLERTAEFIAGRLAARSVGTLSARVPILAASQEVEKGVGGSLGQQGGRRPRAFLRRLVLRALWPYLEDQHRFNRDVLDAVATLQRSIVDLEQRVHRLETQSKPRMQPASEDRKYIENS